MITTDDYVDDSGRDDDGNNNDDSGNIASSTMSNEAHRGFGDDTGSASSLAAGGRVIK